MKAEVIRSFEKDARSIKDKNLKIRLDAVLAEIENAQGIADLTGVVAMIGHPGYYRLRIGDYRLGFQMRGDVMILCRILHRREIYRRFP